MRLRVVSVTSLVVFVVLAASTGTAVAQHGSSHARPDDTRHTGPDYNGGRALPFAPGTQRQAAAIEKPNRAQIGVLRTWLALDDEDDSIYLKKYRLRGIGDHIEVWVADDNDKVASDLNFPDGDCRNGDRTRVTDGQVAGLIDEFDNNIYPIEATNYSVPPARDGSNALLPTYVPMAPNQYRGEGDNIVVLVDNVRDSNFYDTNNAHTESYIAGFFWSLYNEYFDRNVMTIDGWDWAHRTGANPPDEPSTDPCSNNGAHPYLYESVFAHEYQHLLEYYEDVDEASWVNEGLSNFTENLTGYTDFDLSVSQVGFDRAVQCFLGHIVTQTAVNTIPFTGGSENSLTLWGDQNDDPSEILCDYGSVTTIMMMLRSRYGNDFMGDLHREDGNGFAGLQAVLTDHGITATPRQIVHDWLVMAALDGLIDDGASVTGASASRFTASGLDASINWDNDQSYATPGAPPNGADFVRLRDGDGYLSAADITSIDFDGATQHNPKPIEWTVEANPPSHAGNPALFSGSGDNLDRAIVRSVAVPATGATLTFDTYYDTEPLWDFGFVQVSTDGGDTYTSLGNADTTSDHDPGAVPQVVDNVPGFTGNPGGWITTTFDLSDYAGQNVLLSFRYITDSSVTGDGFWVDNVTVGTTVLSNGASLTGWQSLTQANPIDVAGFTVQLVAYTADGSAAWVGAVPIGAGNDGSLSGSDVAAQVGTSASLVAALVTYDEPTELIGEYAPYTLTVNGVEQPGGDEQSIVASATGSTSVQTQAPASEPAPAPAPAPRQKQHARASEEPATSTPAPEPLTSTEDSTKVNKGKTSDRALANRSEKAQK
jgi:hypothetical protein